MQPLGVPAEKEGHDAVGQVHGQAAEAQGGGAAGGIHDGVEIIGQEKLQKTHAEHEGHDEGDTGESRLRMGGEPEADKGHQGQPGEVAPHGAFCGHALHQAGGDQSQQGGHGADDAIPGLADADQAVEVAADGEKQADDAVKHDAQQDEGEGGLGFPDPATGFQDAGQGQPGFVQPAAGRGCGVFRQGRLGHAQGHQQAGDAGEEVQQQGDLHGPGALHAGKAQPAERGGDFFVVVQQTAADGGDDEADGHGAAEAGHEAGPQGLAFGLGQGIIGQGFIRAAGGGFGHAAEDSVGHEKP